MKKKKRKRSFFIQTKVLTHSPAGLAHKKTLNSKSEESRDDDFLFIFLIVFLIIIIFWKREEERKTSRKETLIGCLLYTPNWGSSWQPLRQAFGAWDGVQPSEPHG